MRRCCTPSRAGPMAAPLRRCDPRLGRQPLRDYDTGGTAGLGVVFKVDTSGNETVLYTFTRGPDGDQPYLAGVILDSVGNLYGTTAFGGAGGAGRGVQVGYQRQRDGPVRLPGCGGWAVPLQRGCDLWIGLPPLRDRRSMAVRQARAWCTNWMGTAMRRCCTASPLSHPRVFNDQPGFGQIVHLLEVGDALAEDPPPNLVSAKWSFSESAAPFRQIGTERSVTRRFCSRSDIKTLNGP